MLLAGGAGGGVLRAVATGAARGRVPALAAAPTVLAGGCGSGAPEAVATGAAGGGPLKGGAFPAAWPDPGFGCAFADPGRRTGGPVLGCIGVVAAGVPALAGAGAAS